MLRAHFKPIGYEEQTSQRQLSHQQQNITGMFHDMITEAQDQSDNMAMKAAATYLSVMKSCYGDIIMM